MAGAEAPGHCAAPDTLQSEGSTQTPGGKGQTSLAVYATQLPKPPTSQQHSERHSFSRKHGRKSVSFGSQSFVLSLMGSHTLGLMQSASEEQGFSQTPQSRVPPQPSATKPQSERPHVVFGAQLPSSGARMFLITALTRLSV